MICAMVRCGFEVQVEGGSMAIYTEDLENDDIRKCVPDLGSGSEPAVEFYQLATRSRFQSELFTIV